MKHVLTTFVVVTNDGHWGKGQTVKEAANAALKAGAGKSSCPVVRCYGLQWNPALERNLQSEITVNGYGAIEYPQDCFSIRLFGPSDNDKLRLLHLI